MITVTLSEIIVIRSKFYTSNNVCWMDLTFYDKKGKSEELTIFFSDHAFARRFADAIATITPDTQPTPHDINPDVASQRRT